MANGVLPQRPEFEVTVTSEDGVCVVAVSGELDLDTMAELSTALAAGLRARRRPSSTFAG